MVLLCRWSTNLGCERTFSFHLALLGITQSISFSLAYFSNKSLLLCIARSHHPFYRLMRLPPKKKSTVFHLLVLSFEIKSGTFSALILKKLPSLTKELSLPVNNNFLWYQHSILAGQSHSFSPCQVFIPLMYLKKSVTPFGFSFPKLKWYKPSNIAPHLLALSYPSSFQWRSIG